MTHATRERRPRHTWSRGGLRDSIPRGPPEGGGVGESRPVKEGSRGRPGRHRHKTMTGPGKEGRTERRIGEQEGSENDEKESVKDDITSKGSRRTQNRARKWKMEEVRRREGVRSYYSAARRNTFK